MAPTFTSTDAVDLVSAREHRGAGLDEQQPGAGPEVVRGRDVERLLEERLAVRLTRARGVEGDEAEHARAA
jgi:hypothetical protein